MWDGTEEGAAESVESRSPAFPLKTADGLTLLWHPVYVWKAAASRPSHQLASSSLIAAWEANVPILWVSKSRLREVQ